MAVHPRFPQTPLPENRAVSSFDGDDPGEMRCSPCVDMCLCTVREPVLFAGFPSLRCKLRSRKSRIRCGSALACVHLCSSHTSIALSQFDRSVVPLDTPCL